MTILRRVSSDLSVFPDFNDISDDTLDSFILSLELVSRRLVLLEAINATEYDGLEDVMSCLSTLRSIYDLRRVLELSFNYQIQPVSIGMVGRPSFNISNEQLTYLVENEFSVPQIADMIGVSVSTIRRRMTEFGLSVRARYSQLTEDELDEIVSEIQGQFPCCGNRQMQGHLLSRGFRVQKNRVRESQLRVDHYRVMIRRCRAYVFRRREYSVPSPRSLYHIDGNHKLIRLLLIIIIINT